MQSCAACPGWLDPLQQGRGGQKHNSAAAVRNLQRFSRISGRVDGRTAAEGSTSHLVRIQTEAQQSGRHRRRLHHRLLPHAGSRPRRLLSGCRGGHAPSSLWPTNLKVVRMTTPSGEAACFSTHACVSFVTSLRQSGGRGTLAATAAGTASCRRSLLVLASASSPPPAAAAATDECDSAQCAVNRAANTSRTQVRISKLNLPARRGTPSPQRENATWYTPGRGERAVKWPPHPAVQYIGPERRYRPTHMGTLPLPLAPS